MITPMIKRGVAALTVASCLFTVGIGAAHADDASYLAYLQEHGFNWPPVPGVQLHGGHVICDQLRGGATPDEVAASYNHFPSVMPAGWLEAAQHELCPDTLR